MPELTGVTGYCGFADWPPCADLAATGGDDLTGLVVLAVGVVIIGLIAAGLDKIRPRR